MARFSVFTLATLFLFVALAFTAPLSEQEAKESFVQFIQKYNKNYATQAEAQKRFSIFQDNLKRIDEMNAKKSGAVYGITKFFDLSPEEFKATYLMDEKFLNSEEHKTRRMNSPTMKIDTSVAIPDSFDWRDKNAVTPVKNQGQCGSCWAFSVTETIESAWFLAGNSLIELAPQQIVDCDQGNGDMGCDGGDTPTGYEYVIKAGGMELESAYPYTAEDGSCAFKASEVKAHISNWTYITTNKNETEMLYGLVNHGPLSICVDAESWQFYFGGIVSFLCGNSLDHCVQITGYDNKVNMLDETRPVWLIRNSWGADWGEDGYIWVERGYDLCGVGDEVTIPIV